VVERLLVEQDVAGSSPVGHPINSASDDFQIKTTRPQSNELRDISRNVVDYVFVSKDVQVKNFEVVNNDISDHLPLILDFEL
jgi:endonuclease/exonuclease/phosphatase family metal-dependent hydrolase